jgi:hypothetical protein
MKLHKSQEDYVKFCISVYLDRAELYVQCKATNNAAICRATADALGRALTAENVRVGLAAELQAATHPDVRSTLGLALQKTAQ